MARPLRVEYPGAVYHVFSRGVAKEPIFLDDKDRKRFLYVLETAVERFNFLIHAYCLMDNHYHLLIETPEANISRAIRHINGVYGQGFNRRYERVGPVFQGRFKACLIDKNAYLLEVSRYIVLNPVRAKLVEEPEAWRWSSFRAMVGKGSFPVWLTTHWILQVMGGKTPEEAQSRFRTFVQEGMKTGTIELEKKMKGPILGGKDFVRHVGQLLGEKKKWKEIPRSQRFVGRPDLDSIFNEMKSKSDRNQAVIRAYFQHGYSMKEIADYLNLHYATIKIGRAHV